MNVTGGFHLCLRVSTGCASSALWGPICDGELRKQLGGQEGFLSFLALVRCGVGGWGEVWCGGGGHSLMLVEIIRQTLDISTF